MDFNFTAEQQLLAATVQRFIREDYTFEKRRQILHRTDGWSRDIWQSLAELGLTALNVPEEHGGLNAGAVDTMLVMKSHWARDCCSNPFPPPPSSRPALIRQLNDSQAAGELLPAIASGERIVIVAHQEPQNSR